MDSAKPSAANKSLLDNIPKDENVPVDTIRRKYTKRGTLTESKR